MAVGNETNHTLDGLTVEGGLKVNGQLTLGAVATATGDGTNQAFYSLGATPGVIALNHGTDAVPVTALGPTFKVSRRQQITQASLTAAYGAGSDGCELLASIYGIATGTASDQVQPIGVMGAATTASTSDGGSDDGADACGIYGAGRTTGSGGGTGIGGFFIGRKDTTAAQALGVEIHCSNYSGVDVAYSSTDSPRTSGIWINCGGDADSAVGMQFGQVFGRQWDVGIGFQGTVNGGKTGGVKTTSIRDDSSSVTSINIRGTHTQSLAVASGAGPVVLGANTTGGTGSLMEVVVPTGTISNAVAFNAYGSADGFSIRFGNALGSGGLFVSGGANSFLTGTVAGDPGIRLTSTKQFHIGRDSSRGTIRVTDNVAIGQQADSVGGGVGVVFIANAGTVPASNPTAGGILYTEAGALKFRGSSGTISTVAPA